MAFKDPNDLPKTLHIELEPGTQASFCAWSHKDAQQQVMIQEDGQTWSYKLDNGGHSHYGLLPYGENNATPVVYGSSEPKKISVTAWSSTPKWDWIPCGFHDQTTCAKGPVQYTFYKLYHVQAAGYDGEFFAYAMTFLVVKALQPIAAPLAEISGIGDGYFGEIAIFGCVTDNPPPPPSPAPSQDVNQDSSTTAPVNESYEYEKAFGPPAKNHLSKLKVIVARWEEQLADESVSLLETSRLILGSVLAKVKDNQGGEYVELRNEENWNAWLHYAFKATSIAGNSGYDKYRNGTDAGGEPSDAFWKDPMVVDPWAKSMDSRLFIIPEMERNRIYTASLPENPSTILQFGRALCFAVLEQIILNVLHGTDPICMISMIKESKRIKEGAKRRTYNLARKFDADLRDYLLDLCIVLEDSEEMQRARKVCDPSSSGRGPLKQELQNNFKEYFESVWDFSPDPPTIPLPTLTPAPAPEYWSFPMEDRIRVSYSFPTVEREIGVQHDQYAGGQLSTGHQHSIIISTPEIDRDEVREDVQIRSVLPWLRDPDSSEMKRRHEVLYHQNSQGHYVKDNVFERVWFNHKAVSLYIKNPADKDYGIVILMGNLTNGAQSYPNVGGPSFLSGSPSHFPFSQANLSLFGCYPIGSGGHLPSRPAVGCKRNVQIKNAGDLKVVRHENLDVDPDAQW